MTLAVILGVGWRLAQPYKYKAPLDAPPQEPTRESTRSWIAPDTWQFVQKAVVYPVRWTLTTTSPSSSGSTSAVPVRNSPRSRTCTVASPTRFFHQGDLTTRSLSVSPSCT